jgi:protein-tyrosine phosphatase
LFPHYLGYLGSSVDSVLRLFRALAEPEGVPALLHCTTGNDRTGAAVILLLDAIGVERAAIVEDYVAGAAEIAAVFDTLKALDKKFGGVRAWLRAAGFGDDELVALLDQLTEPR